MKPIALSLVSGGSAALREAAIANELDTSLRTTLILEGLPDGNSPFGESLPACLTIIRIAPGCICCSGNITMRVTLNRVLRQYPEQLYLSLADSRHLTQIRAFLQQEPYDAWLSLIKELRVDSRNSQ